VPITEREKAHDERPAIAVVEDEDEDVNLGNIILERFGENDERGVIVALIREIVAAVRSKRFQRRHKWDRIQTLE